MLDNISYVRAYTHEHQIALLTLACARMIEERIALVIVDSSMALFRVDFSGRGQLAERQIKLGQFLSQLTKMAEEVSRGGRMGAGAASTCVIVTPNLFSWPWLPSVPSVRSSTRRCTSRIRW